MLKSLSVGLLALSLALVAHVCQASHHFLLNEENLRQLTDLSYKTIHDPLEHRCKSFAKALREIIHVSPLKASDNQMVAHALQVLAHKEHSTHPLVQELARCQASSFGHGGILGGQEHHQQSFGHHGLESHAHKAVRKLGLGEAQYFGEQLAGRLHHEKRHLERVLSSKLLDLDYQAREIKHLRHELHELKQVAKGRLPEVAAQIIDRAQFELLKLGHDAALKRVHHLEKFVHELEQELRRGAHGHHPGLVGSGGHGHHHDESKKIHNPIEQAVILSHRLHHHSEHERPASRCYKYYLLFSYPQAVTKKTIKTVANLQIRVKKIEQFFKLVNPNHLSSLLHTANRLAESHEELARGVGHQFRNCLLEAEEYVRHNKIYFDEFDHVDVHLGSSIGHLGEHVSSLHGVNLHRPVGFVETSHHNHSSPSGSTSTSTSTSTTSSGAGAASAASGGATSSTSASASAASASASASASSSNLSHLAPLGGHFH